MPSAAAADAGGWPPSFVLLRTPLAHGRMAGDVGRYRRLHCTGWRSHPTAAAGSAARQPRRCAACACAAVPARRLGPARRFATRRGAAVCCIQSSEDGDAFGATVVSGGDADLDAAAVHVADVVGRVITDDRDHPAYVGADARSEMQAHLVGVVAGLGALAARGDTAPLLLRLSDPAASECVAGVWEPAAASRLRSRILSLLNAARAHRVLRQGAGAPSRATCQQCGALKPIKRYRTPEGG